MTKARVRLQIQEALGHVNRWYCSRHHGREITDAKTLVTYFIRFGGADNFADRWDSAMSRDNRWFCSEHYGFEVLDEQMLWDYFNDHAHAHTPAPCELTA